MGYFPIEVKMMVGAASDEPCAFLKSSRGPKFTSVLSAKYTDDETGLVMYQLRPYSPGLGRFISRDPAEEDGGSLLYGFVANDPLLGVDPLGLWNLASENGRFYALVEEGDTLSGLAAKLTGNGANYTKFEYEGPKSLNGCRIDVTEWIAPALNDIDAYVQELARNIAVRRSLGAAAGKHGAHGGTSSAGADLTENITDLGVAALEYKGTRLYHANRIVYLQLPPKGQGKGVDRIAGSAGKVPGSLTFLRWTGRVLGVAGSINDAGEAATAFGSGDVSGGVRHGSFSAGALVGVFVSGPVGMVAGVGVAISSAVLSGQEIYSNYQSGQQSKDIEWQNQNWKRSIGPSVLRESDSELLRMEPRRDQGIKLFGRFSNTK